MPGRCADMPIRKLVTVLAVAAALCARPAAAADLETVKLPPELARVLADYEAAWQGRSAKALAALFAEDGFVLSSSAPPVRGRAAIEQHYTGQGGGLALRPFGYATDGTAGWIVGGFARQPGSPDVGKFTLTLRKDETGRWLITSDMDNGNSRP